MVTTRVKPKPTVTISEKRTFTLPADLVETIIKEYVAKRWDAPVDRLYVSNEDGSTHDVTVDYMTSKTEELS